MKKYTVAQMRVICNQKLNGAQIKVVFKDSKAHIVADKGDREVLLFTQSYEEHFAIGGR